MDPITGAALLTGGANLLGSIFSSSTSASNTQAQIAAQQQMLGQTEQFNSQQAQVQRDYETQMSNTAYQRASQDMKAAGLNPMMMFGSGSSASTPGGATASIGTPSVPMPQKTSPLAGLGSAVSSAVDSMVKSKQIDYLASQIAKTDTDTKIREAGDYPEARVRGETARYVDAFMQNHPDIAQAASVGPWAGKAVDETLKPGFDALQSTFGGLGSIARTLFGSKPTSLKNSAVSTKPSATNEAVPDVGTTNSATAVRRGMDMEQELQKWLWKKNEVNPAALGGRNPGTGGSFD